jgi:hypothetical protein
MESEGKNNCSVFATGARCVHSGCVTTACTVLWYDQGDGIERAHALELHVIDKFVITVSRLHGPRVDKPT